VLSVIRRDGATGKDDRAAPYPRKKKARTGPVANLGSAQNVYIVRLSMNGIYDSCAEDHRRAGDG
jgi:hypothetical protein